MQVVRKGGSAAVRPKGWQLEQSELFSRRLQECDARDYGDSLHDFTRQFETDWARVVIKSRFVRLLSNTDRAALRGDKDELARGVPRKPDL